MRLLTRPAIALFLVVCSLLAAPPVTQPKRPKLVVAIIIDQFRYDYLLRFRADFNSGLAQLLEQGAVFTDAQYLHAFTVTAIGHSTFLSGAPPATSGIVANEWYDRESQKTVTSVTDLDPKIRTIGGTGKEAGASPRRLLVSTIGDELKLAGVPSKSIGVSIKDRSAILPVGRMGDGAYWVDAKSNQWVGSTYYVDDLPAWAKAVNDKKTPEKYLKAQWLPFDAKDGSAKPFCSMTPMPGVRNCGNLDATPWGNEMIEDFAEAALDGEGLGKHQGTDLLAVSFSANDYVGHAVGPNSPDVRDITIRTDRLLGKLLAAIQRKVGLANTLIVLSADHGVAPVPEEHDRKLGGRIDAKAMNASLETALAKRFGEGHWLEPAPAGMVYLNQETIAAKKLNPAAVEDAAAAVVRSIPHIARVYTKHQMINGNVPPDDIGRAIAFSYYAPRSGDLYVLQEPYYLMGGTSGTSHGTPYRYDTHVPVIFMGPGIQKGAYSNRISPNDIAPTLANLLGIQEPSGSIGRVLTEMLPR